MNTYDRLIKEANAQIASAREKYEGEELEANLDWVRDTYAELIKEMN